MANKPVTMNRIRLIMQSQNQGESIMEISRKYGISRNTIKKYRNSLSLDGSVTAPITGLSDEQLSEQLQIPWRKKIVEPDSVGSILKKNSSSKRLLISIWPNSCYGNNTKKKREIMLIATLSLVITYMLKSFVLLFLPYFIAFHQNSLRVFFKECLFN